MKKIYILCLMVLMVSAANAQYIYNDFDQNQNVEFTGWPNAPTIIENPDQSGINTSAHVAEWIRSGEQWAHVYAVLDGKIDFSTGSEFHVKVWSPVSCEVLFKLEDKNNPGIFTEVIEEVTEPNQWVQLVFDFSGAQSNMYDKIVIFFDFAATADNTFYFDDVIGPEIGEAEEPGPGVTLPVTFDDPDINYGIVDFGGNISEIIVDPTDETNMVVQSIKGEGAEFWAGTTVAAGVGFEEPIPFTEEATTMSVRVWAPEAGIPVRLKVEAANDPTISVETEATTTVAEDWNTLVFDFANEVEGTAPINFNNEYNMASIFFNFGTPGAGETFYWDDIEFIVETDDELFIYNDFEDNQNVAFSGWPNVPAIIENPYQSGINTSAHVAEWIRSGEQWAHVYAELDGKIDFSTGSEFHVKVWSPVSCEVLFKLEDKNNPGIFAEVIQEITETNQWTQLVFDFPDAQPNMYDKIVIFFDFASVEDNTFYFDDVMGPQIGEAEEPAPGVTLPVTFDDPDIDYGIVDFGGNISEIIVDPTDETNMVVQSIKGEGAEFWAGTTVAAGVGFEEPIPFTEEATTMSVRVWAPEAGIPVRLKVEAANDPTISVETEATTTVAEDWNTLVFDFANEVEGTAPINFNNQYNMASIFFNFGTPGAGETYYWDDIEFIVETDDELFIYNDFEDNQNVAFSGWPNAPVIIENPDQSGINTSAHVAEWIRSGEQWAHVYAELDGKIDFSTGSEFHVKVWSPVSCEVLFKLEDKTNPGITTEIIQEITETSQWTQLVFDFPDAQPNMYDKIVIFFDFASVEDNTFYFDDVMGPQIGEAEEPAPGVTLPVTFDDPDIDYGIVDFGGNISEIIVDPTDGSNMVVQTLKGEGAEFWAGTTVAAGVGFEEPIPFTEEATTMSVRVWAPEAGIPVRLKVEAANDPTISVETEATTTVAEDWNTLVFDFANEVEGTAPINFNNEYNMASVFFNFGTPGAGETFYWDDIEFGGEIVDEGFTVTFIVSDEIGNPVTDATITFNNTENEEGDYVFEGVFPGVYEYTVVKQCYQTAENEIEIIDQDLTLEVILLDINGDANGDGVINILDVIAVSNFWGTQVTPVNWCFNNADINNDGIINILDIIGITNIFSGNKVAPFDGLKSKSAQIYLNEQGILLNSDGTLAGIEFYISGNTADLELKLEVPGYELVYVNDNDKLRAMIFSFDNNPFAEGRIQLVSFESVNKDLSWEKVIAGNLNAEKVEVVAKQDEPANISEIYIYNDFDENQNVAFSGWPNAPSIIANPDPSGINTSANVAEWQRSGEQWAHVYAELDGKINFSAEQTFQVKVWSPVACEVLFKLEDKTDNGIFTEVLQNVTETEEWVQLSFDFSGAQSEMYDKIVIFFDFAATADNTFYFDDVMGPGFGEGEDPGEQVTLPVTFNDPDVNYNLIDFGGAFSEIVIDPTDESNMVAKTTKLEEAETWAGTTIGGTQGFPQPIPFTPDATTMSVDVWSPLAGSPVRIKVEDSADPTISVETEVLTTVANEWETLFFDFTNEAEGTAEINFDYNYNKASIFFNFGTSGADAGELTYYWDNMAFEGDDDDNGDDDKPLEAWDVQENFEDDGYSTIPHWYFQDPDMIDLPINADPLDENNHVGDYNRSGNFEWTNAQFVLNHRMDLTSKNVFEMKVYFPSSNDYSGDLASTAAIKLQNSLLGEDAWTTQEEIAHTVAEYDTWVTLEFDFSIAADRTDFDQVVIQLGGEGHFAPGQFYFDDLLLKEEGTTNIVTKKQTNITLYPNPSTDRFTISGNAEIKSIRIYNMQGQLVFTESGNISSVGVSGFVNGLYHVVLETVSGDIHTSKIIKQ